VRQMQDNLNKASQRGDRLDALQDKTDNLATSAQGFRRGANRVRKQMWWKDMKMRICIIVGIIILLIVIIVPSGKDSPRSPFWRDLDWKGKSIVGGDAWLEMHDWIYMCTHRENDANECSPHSDCFEKLKP
jgi:hypothetical protein